MLPRWLTALFVLCREAWSARRDTHIRFLKLQVEILRSRLPGNRVIPNPTERRRLLKIGAEMGHAVDHTLDIISIKTYRRWLREEQVGRQVRKVGRPRLTKALRELIVRLAKENLGWGTRRIVGELTKLAVKASRSSVRRVLVDERVLPDPDRHAPKGVQTPWRKFIKIHMNVMVATDFFTKTIWTPLGKRTAYMLSFIHLGTRKVFLSPSTYHPTGEWVRQQARNLRMWAEDQDIDIRFLIHDRDSKFTEDFDEYFSRSDGGPVKTPYQSPIANCFIESWIGNLKRECLNHFFCFSLRQMDYIAQIYASYYNRYRPHQGLDNRPLGASRVWPGELRASVTQEIHPKQWLGGLLKHYYRKAA